MKTHHRTRPNGPTDVAGSSSILTIDELRKIIEVLDRECVAFIPGHPTDLEMIADKLRLALLGTGIQESGGLAP
jgi:hypothetical protein